MTEKFFYIATLDGDSPHQWTPFSDKNENLSSLSQLVSTWQMNIDRPDNRVIRLGLSLIPRAKLFTNGFDRVYGFLIDGSHFRDKQSDRDIDHDLELAIRKILKENKSCKLFGLVFYPLIDSEDEEVWGDVQIIVERICRGVCGDIQYTVSPITSPTSLKRQLRVDLMRFRAREPFAETEID